MQFEYSAGGVAVNEHGRLLMVKVKNLKGDIVWTFPKGHVEKGEKSEETAKATGRGKKSSQKKRKQSWLFPLPKPENYFKI